MGHPSAHHGAWGSAFAITFDETLLTSKNGRGDYRDRSGIRSSKAE